MAAPHMRLTTADHVEAIGMRVLRGARNVRSSSRHHGHSDPLIEDVEQLAQNLRERVG
ncbi:hypothetical protein [Sphingomonas aerolata]|uniref:hypothetical protein n=1 Tax=Sphingomonas aerolata TaxID=185951 RepID=UPI00142E43DE|nr:hypothetical protein [Sphingomonas aerolata]